MIKSWMVIGAVTIAVGFLGSQALSQEDQRWFDRLQRPKWLTFENAIPVIWTIVFIAAAWSAYIVWESNPGSRSSWLLMGFYLVLELVTLAYNVLMCKLKSLLVGTVIGATCVLLSAILAVIVWDISQTASLLLLPYILWSPIGTYTTWEMLKLNPVDR
ncbi:MAG TPA: TspO/MBR family protein [Oscillatoriales cyanobacterium M59_W2019_021]|nr:TspO/MBR family protein [Oscillatoriales cyanobacterium M4454_W2019_049]HIK50561.1 TspO/MBR family protein [Oscillatoriales cyanobacterium M59_W2019_021]